MRVYKGVGGTSYVDDFDGINSLAETVRGRPPCTQYDPWFRDTIDCFGRNCSVSKSWVGFDTSDEVLDTFRYGTIDTKMMEKIHRFATAMYVEHATPRDTIEFMPFGGIISIPKVIANSPDYKVIPLVEERQDKTIELGIDGAVSCMVSKSDVERIGLAIMGMVAHLEAEGYNLRIRLLSTNRNTTNKKCLSLSMLLKDYGDTLDMSRILMPIITPAFHRVIMFGWMARHSQSDGCTSMGHPLKHDLRSDEMSQYYREVFNLDHVISIQTIVRSLGKLSDEQMEKEIVREVLEGTYS